MRHIHKFVTADALLADAARAARRAAKACREWEQGGSPEVVGDSAEVAFSAASGALAAIEMEDEAEMTAGLPETRRARLVLAAHLLMLAGTDEHGESSDLSLAARIFRRAAIA